MKKWKPGDVCHYYHDNKLRRCVITQIMTLHKMKPKYSQIKSADDTWDYVGVVPNSEIKIIAVTIEEIEDEDNIYTIESCAKLYSSVKQFRKSIPV